MRRRDRTAAFRPDALQPASQRRVISESCEFLRARAASLWMDLQWLFVPQNMSLFYICPGRASIRRLLFECCFLLQTGFDIAEGGDGSGMLCVSNCENFMFAWKGKCCFFFLLALSPSQPFLPFQEVVSPLAESRNISSCCLTRRVWNQRFVWRCCSRQLNGFDFLFVYFYFIFGYFNTAFACLLDR